MKKCVRMLWLCLLVQAAVCWSGKVSAQLTPADSLNWVWEVTSTTSTKTKTLTLEFTGNLWLNWGDGVTEWVGDSLSKKVLTHVYSSVGNYTCIAAGASLAYFKADSRRLLALYPQKAPHLTYISCTSSQLTALDVSSNTLLETLYCGSNELTALDVSKNTKLEALTCSDNKLTQLDFTGLSLLKKVTCHTNPLTNLTVPSTGVFSYLSCTSCQLTAETLDQVFQQLPTLQETPTSQNLYISDNPGSATCHTELATVKRWVLEKTVTKSVVFVPTATSKVGDTAVVAINLTNTLPIVAFEIDLQLPEGFEMDTLRSRLEASRRGNHLLSVAKTLKTPPTYKLMAYSMTSNDTLKGREGTLLQLYLTVPDTVRTYTIDIKKVVLVDTAAQSADVSVTDGKLEVLPVYTIGDADGDYLVNVTDVVWLVATINGSKPLGFQDDAMDLDENGVWNVIDVVQLIKLINETAILPSNAAALVLSTSPRSIRVLQPYQATSGGVDNHVYLTQSSDNSAEIALCLDNENAVQALQADIVLPEGLSLVTGEAALKPERAQTHTFSVQAVAGDLRRYRVLVWSMQTGKTFSGNTGALLTLKTQQSSNVAATANDTATAYLDESVLTGLDLRTLKSLTYETRLNFSDAAISSDIRAGSAGKGLLWVKGKGLSQVTVFDLRSIVVSECLNVVGSSVVIPLRKGFYLVKAVQANKAPKVLKVYVP